MIEFLMTYPHQFRVEYSINKWMDENNTVDDKLAIEQWKELKKTLESINCLVHVFSCFEKQKELPDSVFVANVGFVLGKDVILSNFKYPQRAKETSLYNFSNFNQSSILPKNMSFEGTGDCLIHRSVKNLVYCGYGYRTDLSSIEYLEKQLPHINLLPIELINDNFYHLDTCLTPLPNGYILLVREAISDLSFHKLENILGPDKIITIDQNDAINFICNSIEIDGKFFISNSGISQELKDILINKIGFSEIIELNMSEFLKGGGGVRCMVLRLTEDFD